MKKIVTVAAGRHAGAILHLVACLALGIGALLMAAAPVHAAVYRINNQIPEIFIGLSSDTKPTLGVHSGAQFLETNTNKLWLWKNTSDQGAAGDWVENYQAVTMGTAQAGERNIGSTTGTDYVAALSECKSSGEIDLASGSGTIYPGPALICGFMISTTPGTAASSIDDNVTAKIPLPVSFPVNVYPGFGTIISTSLKYTRGSGTGTGKFVVWYHPLGDVVTWP